MSAIENEFNFNSKTTDLIRWLSAAKTDDQIAEFVRTINQLGKKVFGPHFAIRFDRTIISRNIRRRIFIRRPRYKVCA